MFVFFVFDKNGLIKRSCSSFEDLSVYKISWSHVGWCKFCIHLRSLNVHHFGMVKGTGLKSRRRGHLQWHDLPTEFYKNLSMGSKVIRGDTDRQTGDLISLTFLFKESRLKIVTRWCVYTERNVNLLANCSHVVSRMLRSQHLQVQQMLTGSFEFNHNNEGYCNNGLQ
jgi:hypothetical protein